MNEEKRAGLLFLLLLIATLLSVGASRFHLARGMAVSVALGFAAVKAFLIGWFFMRLNSSGPVPRAVVAIGIIAVLILSIGILPDVGWFKK